MVTVDGHTVHSSVATLIIVLVLIFIFMYALPTLYNFWILFKKANKPGWAAIIPIYGPIVACQIAKKPIWLGIVFGLSSALQVSAPSDVVYVINAIQLVILLIFGVIILSGLAKQYNKASRVFWILMFVLPLAASYMVKPVQYKPSR